MTNVHLRLDGTWAECHAVKRACPRDFHLSDMTVEQTELLPPTFMERLIDDHQPPRIQGMMIRAGLTADFWLDTDGKAHRDYGLPAMVGSDGFKVWMQHGVMHRGHGLPAVENPSGGRIFFNRKANEDMEYTRAFREWWEHDKLIRYEARNFDRADFEPVAAAEPRPGQPEFIQTNHF